MGWQAIPGLPDQGSLGALRLPGSTWIQIFDQETSLYYHPPSQMVSIGVPDELAADLGRHATEVLFATVGTLQQLPIVRMHLGDWLVLDDPEETYFYHISSACFCPPPEALLQIYIRQLRIAKKTQQREHDGDEMQQQRQQQQQQQQEKQQGQQARQQGHAVETCFQLGFSGQECQHPQGQGQTELVQQPPPPPKLQQQSPWGHQPPAHLQQHGLFQSQRLSCTSPPNHPTVASCSSCPLSDAPSHGYSLPMPPSPSNVTSHKCTDQRENDTSQFADPVMS